VVVVVVVWWWCGGGSEIRSVDFPAFHFRVFGGAPPPLQ